MIDMASFPVFITFIFGLVFDCALYSVFICFCGLTLKRVVAFIRIFLWFSLPVLSAALVELFSRINRNGFILFRHLFPVTCSPARDEAFGIPEVLENILEFLPLQDILNAQAVNRRWRDTIQVGLPVRKAAFMAQTSESDNTEATHLAPDYEDVDSNDFLLSRSGDIAHCPCRQCSNDARIQVKRFWKALCGPLYMNEQRDFRPPFMELYPYVDFWHVSPTAGVHYDPVHELHLYIPDRSYARNLLSRLDKGSWGKMYPLRTQDSISLCVDYPILCGYMEDATKSEKTQYHIHWASKSVHVKECTMAHISSIAAKLALADERLCPRKGPRHPLPLSDQYGFVGGLVLEDLVDYRRDSEVLDIEEMELMRDEPRYLGLSRSPVARYAVEWP